MSIRRLGERLERKLDVVIVGQYHVGEKVERLDRRLDGVGVRLDRVERSLERTTAGSERLDRKREDDQRNLEAHIDQSLKLSMLDAQIRTIDRQLTASCANADNRGDPLLSEINGKLMEMSSKLDDFDRRMSTVEVRLASQERRIEEGAAAPADCRAFRWGNAGHSDAAGASRDERAVIFAPDSHASPVPPLGVI